jgi:pantetheine-phosphate adenylyltransferase
MTTAIYPGTFDPITRGHIDVIERAARLFDRVVVAVAVGHHKTPGLSLQDRVALARDALHHLPEVEVASFDGLIVDFAAHREASVIIRGLRTTDNLFNELAMAATNRGMTPSLQTVFLPASEGYDHISSTVIREIAACGGDISAYVHREAEERVRERYGSKP